MTQFYKLTLERAIADYRDGLITATGLLRYYLKIRYAKGWKINLNPTEICSLLGFTKATFYKALAKLKKLGRVEIGKLTLIPLVFTEDERGEGAFNNFSVCAQLDLVAFEAPFHPKRKPGQSRTGFPTVRVWSPSFFGKWGRSSRVPGETPGNATS
ncbi:MAG: hypothetical protein AB4038_13000, partial [Prochloraceae cyanobacterium]